MDPGIERFEEESEILLKMQASLQTTISRKKMGFAWYSAQTKSGHLRHLRWTAEGRGCSRILTGAMQSVQNACQIRSISLRARSTFTALFCTGFFDYSDCLCNIYESWRQSHSLCPHPSADCQLIHTRVLAWQSRNRAEPLWPNPGLPLLVNHSLLCKHQRLFRQGELGCRQSSKQ